jgi:hypothetical protein
MNVKAWRQAASRYLLPDLPGRWQVGGWAVHRDSGGWFSQAVLASISWSTLRVNAIVQFLAVPRYAWMADVSSELGTGWTVPATIEDAEPIMRELAQLIPAQAVRFFDEHATLEARLSYLRQRVAMLEEHTNGSGFLDHNVDEELAYVHLLRGDLDGVAQAAQWAEQAAAHDSSPWAVEANNRVQRVATAARRDPDEATRMLREQAAWTRKALKIPTPSEHAEPA